VVFPQASHSIACTISYDLSSDYFVPNKWKVYDDDVVLYVFLFVLFEGFAGTNQGKSTPPSGTSEQAGRVDNKKREEGDRKGKGRLTGAGDHDRDDEESYPVENRSSGSGESTPVGTIIQSRGKKTDPYRGYSDLRSDSILSNVTNRSINEDEATLEDSSDELKDSDDNILKKSNFPHFTMHLDQISVLDEEEGNASFSSELNHVSSWKAQISSAQGERINAS